jgi:lipoate-protein ligase A
MLVELKEISRRDLVETLEELLSDEYDSSELVYLTEEDLIRAIMNAAIFYKEDLNRIEDTLAEDPND